MDQQTLQNSINKLYPETQWEYQYKRYKDLADKFIENYNTEPIYFFSTPGRTEICGNHTDHNNGRVLAASINLDTIAAVTPNRDNLIRLISEGFPEKIIIDIDQVQKQKNEAGTTLSLIKGIVNNLKLLEYQVHGFNCYIKSNVLIGSGLSSSASFEILIGTIINTLFCHEQITKIILAKTGQYAENLYFGKPCGLMDQIACATGKIVSIDFEDPINPQIKPISFDFNKAGYGVLIVDTGGSHADLTHEYAAIPAEMKTIADHFYTEVCRDISESDLISKIPQIRQKTGDRAILRTLHFLKENDRVGKIITALENDDIRRFLQLVNESGNSSYKYLQNIYSPGSPKNQGVSLALYLTEDYINTIDAGACRIHGGGFAGTILVFLPLAAVEDYKTLIEPVFGAGSVTQIFIRNYGSVCLNRLT